jgi:hypothetical protein
MFMTRTKRRRSRRSAARPEQIARNPKSYTGAYLKSVLVPKGAKRSAAE